MDAIAERNGVVSVQVSQSTKHAGMGIAVGVRHILTCAHVVNVAMLRVDKNDRASPGSFRLRFTFPDSPGEPAMEGQLLSWLPPRFSRAAAEDADDSLDAALFELDQDIPAEVGLARLAAWSRRTLMANRSTSTAWCRRANWAATSAQAFSASSGTAAMSLRGQAPWAGLWTMGSAAARSIVSQNVRWWVSSMR